jgi:ABC-2 type transport system ATP-binding protein
MEVRGPSDAVASFLHEQPEISSCESKAIEHDLTAFEIKTKDRKDQRELLASRVLAKGWSLRRIDLKKVRLIDVYTSVVMPKAEPAVAAEPPAPIEPQSVAV